MYLSAREIRLSYQMADIPVSERNFRHLTRRAGSDTVRTRVLRNGSGYLCHAAQTPAVDGNSENLPLIGFLIVVNAILPLLLVRGFNRSLTQRISELSKVFETVGGEHLVPISYVRGKDEIGSLMSNYNRMVARTNELIQIVYKNKIKEQEMLVERQNAELLALHSQINPHFLFNALESIRMHSLLKNEYETADMVEKLALMQRQYVEWETTVSRSEQEMEFVRAYLGLAEVSVWRAVKLQS